MCHRLNWLYSLVAAILLLCLSGVSRAAATDENTSSSYVAGEVIVTLRPGADIRAVATSYGLQPTPREQLNGHAIYRMQIVDGAAPPTKAARLATDLRVAYAEPNYLGQTPESRQQSSWTVGGDSGGYRAQWASDKIRLPEAHTVTQGASVIVAVLDTGADLSHPALVQQLTPGFDFVDNDSDPSEIGVYGQDYSYGHGTHVAGLVAFAAPQAKIMPLRTLKPDGTGTIWAQAEALRYALDQGADVINLSFSYSTPSKLLNDILGEVTCGAPVDVDCRTGARPGVVVVAAAGNSGTRNPQYPAATWLPGVLAVAASTESDTLAAFSSYGVWVDVAAPGERILSCVPGGGYGTWSGTSMSTPLVAGTAALVRAAYPAMQPAAVAVQITTTGNIISEFVQRRIDAAVAVGLPVLVTQR
jgi:subtilisin family serine protease